VAGANLNPVYEDSWARSRAKLSLTGEDFDYHWEPGEEFICNYPWWEYTDEIHPDGTRLFQTRDVMPDLPALLVYYRVEGPDVHFLGLSTDWSEDELAPE
jgi:hypothetical protein